MHDAQPTNQDILEAINVLAGQIEDRFTAIDQRFESIDKRLADMHQRFDGIEHELVTIKATMIVKDYLDDKLAARKADLIAIDKKQEEKVNTLTEILASKKALSTDEAQQISRISPFPVPPIVTKS